MMNRDHDLDWEAGKYWANSENKTAALAIIMAADVVTTPHEAWAQDLKPFNNNVIVLPDVEDAVSGGRFFIRFVQAIELCYGLRWGWVHAVSGWFAARSMAKVLRNKGLP